MKKTLLIVICLCNSAIWVSAQTPNTQSATTPTQQTSSATNPNAEKMTNADVMALGALGLSDDIVITKIYAAKATEFDTSIAGLTSLKNAKISDDVIRVMLNPQKPDFASPTAEIAPPEPNPNSVAVTSGKPRIFFQSKSSGNTGNASRDQSMEMSKDFEKNCPEVQITLAQQSADYTVALSHIELGLMVRDNQVQLQTGTVTLCPKQKRAEVSRQA